MCSTPFGITEYIGHAEQARRAGDYQVLNAFRHHGIYRELPARAKSSMLIGAQRLSASRNISVVTSTQLAALTLMCSTPFGITEYIGLDPRRGAVHHLLVLNAFRHHGIYRAA